LRLIGLDPGLQRTGWGVVDSTSGGRLSYVAHGVVTSNARQALAERLRELYDALGEVLRLYEPHEAAVEETFVNKNPSSTLKLGQARAIAMLAPAMYGIAVAEYTPNLVKKSIVGTGHAQKEQVAMMVRTLLPTAGEVDGDAADALAVAICHAHFRQTDARIAAAAASAGGRA
jgi:crossover junction endodeoxyribonuclease RuvC